MGGKGGGGGCLYSGTPDILLLAVVRHILSVSQSYYSFGEFTTAFFLWF